MTFVGIMNTINTYAEDTYGDQTKVEEHMLRCIEQIVCKKSYMHPNHTTNFNDWYMKTDPPM